MKKHFRIFTALVIALILSYGCKSRKDAQSENQITTLTEQSFLKDVKFPINTEIHWGSSFNHPSFAIWVEDMEGNYIQSLFVTKAVATGIFGNAQASDSTWSAEPGESYRPAALPVWFHKKGLLDDGSLVPTPKNQFVDAIVGATPKNNVRLNSGTKESPRSKFRVYLEVNQTWDWNEYYHNNLYPNNLDYKSSAQPSLVYGVTVDMESPFNEWHLNPVGHGHYAGEDGLLYTDISKHTTALDIIEKAIIRIQK